MNRLPNWFHQELPGNNILTLARNFKESGVHTVCQEARCPNISGCFKKNQATFIVLGDICTRNCKFCAVKKAGFTHLGVDSDEPERIAETVKNMGMSYVVITSVTRDDLSDGGAGIFAETVNAIRKINRDIKIELLIPDLEGKLGSLKVITQVRPDVMAHNIETVERLYQTLRPMAEYKVSLGVIRDIKELAPSIITKSSLMLGMGETKGEVIKVMQDLRKHCCDILTLGQYLAPSAMHYPVKEFITPEQFEEYKMIAIDSGFKSVFSAPLARSSFCAEKVFNERVMECTI